MKQKEKKRYYFSCLLDIKPLDGYHSLNHVMWSVKRDASSKVKPKVILNLNCHSLKWGKRSLKLAIESFSLTKLGICFRMTLSSLTFKAYTIGIVQV